MTPEQRAAQIARSFAYRVDPQQEIDELEAVISAALREARNEALEEAAGVVYGLCVSDNNAKEIVTRILALKDKPT